MTDQRLDHLRWAVHLLRQQRLAIIQRIVDTGAMTIKDEPLRDVYLTAAEQRLSETDRIIDGLETELRVLALSRGVDAEPDDWVPAPPAFTPEPRRGFPTFESESIAKPNRAARRSKSRK